MLLYVIATLFTSGTNNSNWWSTTLGKTLCERDIKRNFQDATLDASNYEIMAIYLIFTLGITSFFFIDYDLMQYAKGLQATHDCSSKIKIHTKLIIIVIIVN